MNRNRKAAADVNGLKLLRTGFKAAYWRLFFHSDPAVEQGRIELPVNGIFSAEKLKPEILFIDGSRRVPLQTYFQYDLGIAATNDVYIFQSVTDALAYFQLKMMDNAQVVFLALGKNPSDHVLEYVRKHFSGAHFFLAYPKSLLARVAEIRIIGYLTGERLAMKLKDDRLFCRYRDREVSMVLDSVSLSKVSKLTGFWPKIRTLKPPKGYDSFYDLLRENNAMEA